MRRTTLAAIIGVALALAAPAAAQALNVYAATSLTSVFPALDKAPKFRRVSAPTSSTVTASGPTGVSMVVCMLVITGDRYLARGGVAFRPRSTLPCRTRVRFNVQHDPPRSP